MPTISGDLWTHEGVPFPADLNPELWFRPERPGVTSGALLAGVEVQATVNWSNGRFTVDLVAYPGIRYQPFMRWLVNPQETDPEKWAFGYAEWPFTIDPNNGGNIGTLIPVQQIGLMWIGPTPPPPGANGSWPTGTRWLVTDPSSSDYGYIVKWS
jgi:hypothetical protein